MQSLEYGRLHLVLHFNLFFSLIKKLLNICYSGLLFKVCCLYPSFSSWERNRSIALTILVVYLYHIVRFAGCGIHYWPDSLYHCCSEVPGRDRCLALKVIASAKCHIIEKIILSCLMGFYLVILQHHIKPLKY